MSHVGERITQRRQEKNLSLAELARRAEVSKGYLHSIESGETQRPSAETLFKIANALSTTIADLLGEASITHEDDGILIIPDTLREFAEIENLTSADVQMLARIEYRGKRPDTVDDWRFIFESIKRTLR
jgi:transcriptional regulator with XRE-family HTH domain